MSIDLLIDIINEELCKLNNWFKINKLSLNVSKSNFMTFGNKTIVPKPVLLNNVPLTQVTVTKFLGVYIDSKFVWDKQISIVKRKLYNVIGIMNRIKEKVDSDILITVYNTLMLPHLSYCCEIWGNTYCSRLKDIVILQKRAMRLIDKADFTAHTSPIFKKYNVLKFTDLVEFNSCMVMYKASNNLLPVNVQGQFIKNKEVHNYRTRNREKLHVQNVRSSLKHISVNNKGVRLWNKLDEKLRSTVSINLFKKRLKLQFIQKY